MEFYSCVLQGYTKIKVNHPTFKFPSRGACNLCNGRTTHISRALKAFLMLFSLMELSSLLLEECNIPVPQIERASNFPFKLWYRKYEI